MIDTPVGMAVGKELGSDVGFVDEGTADGGSVGILDGAAVGSVEGRFDGVVVGGTEGREDGLVEGVPVVGTGVGARGTTVGLTDGSPEGTAVDGRNDGKLDGFDVRLTDGLLVGKWVGREEGP